MPHLAWNDSLYKNRTGSDAPFCPRKGKCPVFPARQGRRITPRGPTDHGTGSWKRTAPVRKDLSKQCDRAKIGITGCRCSSRSGDHDRSGRTERPGCGTNCIRSPDPKPRPLVHIPLSGRAGPSAKLPENGQEPGIHRRVQNRWSCVNQGRCHIAPSDAGFPPVSGHGYPGPAGPTHTATGAGSNSRSCRHVLSDRQSNSMIRRQLIFVL